MRGQATPRPQHYANEELQTKMKLAARQTLQITPLPILCVCLCLPHSTVWAGIAEARTQPGYGNRTAVTGQGRMDELAGGRDGKKFHPAKFESLTTGTTPAAV